MAAPPFESWFQSVLRALQGLAVHAWVLRPEGGHPHRAAPLQLLPTLPMVGGQEDLVGTHSCQKTALQELQWVHPLRQVWAVAEPHFEGMGWSGLRGMGMSRPCSGH